MNDPNDAGFDPPMPSGILSTFIPGQPRTASERAAWVRERAAARGMTPQAYAEYVAALRKDYATIAGPGARLVSGLGLGWVPVPPGTRDESAEAA